MWILFTNHQMCRDHLMFCQFLPARRYMLEILIVTMASGTMHVIMDVVLRLTTGLKIKIYTWSLMSRMWILLDRSPGGRPLSRVLRLQGSPGACIQKCHTWLSTQPIILDMGLSIPTARFVPRPRWHFQNSETILDLSGLFWLRLRLQERIYTRVEWTLWTTLWRAEWYRWQWYCRRSPPKSWRC